MEIGLAFVLLFILVSQNSGAVIAANPDDTKQLKAMNAPYVITEARCQTGKSESEHWLLIRPLMALTVNLEVFFFARFATIPLIQSSLDDIRENDIKSVVTSLKFILHIY